jgi:hypothetical protein
MSDLLPPTISAEELEETEETNQRIDRLHAVSETTEKANGSTVSLSNQSLLFLAQALAPLQLSTDDQRVRRNIQWGIVRGLLLFNFIMIPLIFVVIGMLGMLGMSHR